MNKFRFVDLFCGGGGSITGAIEALNAAEMPYEGRGFNHWPIAIRTIQANHPEVVPDFDRACTPIEAVVPDKIFPDDPQRIDVIWASPSCTHHSVARGGKPRSDQLRSQPEHLLPYLRLTRCRRMYIENVLELKSWGPTLDKDTRINGKLYKEGQPDPRKAGVYFNGLIREIKNSGYRVDMAVMNAADYGAATNRKRLIIQCVRKSAGEKIYWPEPTHSRTPDLFGTEPWWPASSVIDWTIKGESIFTRKKPLYPNTMKRIKAGIKKYWGQYAEPFLIVMRGTSERQLKNTALPVSMPLPTISTSGAHFALIEPLFLPQQSGGTAKPVSVPLSTIATSGAIGLIEPFICKYYKSGKGICSINEPLPTITTKDRFAIIGGLVEDAGGQTYRLDITHRMLTAPELAAATGFPAGYAFSGGETDAKMQIGNAVCPCITSALYRAFLAA